MGVEEEEEVEEEVVAEAAAADAKLGRRDLQLPATLLFYTLNPL